MVGARRSFSSNSGPGNREVVTSSEANLSCHEEPKSKVLEDLTFGGGYVPLPPKK